MTYAEKRKLVLIRGTIRIVDWALQDFHPDKKMISIGELGKYYGKPQLRWNS